MVRPGLHLPLLAALQKQPRAPAWGRAGHSPGLGLARGADCAHPEGQGKGKGVRQAESTQGDAAPFVSIDPSAPGCCSCRRPGGVLPLRGGKGKCPHIPHTDLPSPGTTIQQKKAASTDGCRRGEGKVGGNRLHGPVTFHHSARLPTNRQRQPASGRGEQPPSPSPSGE